MSKNFDFEKFAMAVTEAYYSSLKGRAAFLNTEGKWEMPEKIILGIPSFAKRVQDEIDRELGK
jgi:hypothetical protein